MSNTRFFVKHLCTKYNKYSFTQIFLEAVGVVSKVGYPILIQKKYFFFIKRITIKLTFPYTKYSYLVFFYLFFYLMKEQGKAVLIFVDVRKNCNFWFFQDIYYFINLEDLFMLARIVPVQQKDVANAPRLLLV